MLPFRSLSCSIPRNPPPYQCYNKREDRGPYNRPDNRKCLATHLDGKYLRQTKLPCNPKADPGADKAYNNGNEAAAEVIACKGLSYATADGCNNKKNDKFGECHDGCFEVYLQFECRAGRWH